MSIKINLRKICTKNVWEWEQNLNSSHRQKKEWKNKNNELTDYEEEEKCKRLKKEQWGRAWLGCCKIVGVGGIEERLLEEEEMQKTMFMWIMFVFLCFCKWNNTLLPFLFLLTNKTFFVNVY